MIPVRKGVGGIYHVDCGLDYNKLEHIPGLQYSTLGQGVGPIDAVSVALHRMGMPWMPALKPIGVFDGEPYWREYQKEGIAWLTQQIRREHAALLADDMGLGKTLQTLETWRRMRALGLNVTPLLIVCPASVRETWKAQINKWIGDSARAYMITPGKSMKQFEALMAGGGTPPQVVVSSYELAQRLVACGFRPSMLVLDEAHKLRGRTTKQARAFWQLGAIANYRLGLTGTPMWGRVRDMWCVLKVLFGKRFGTAEEFDYAYCAAQPGSYGNRDNIGSSREDELAHRLTHVMLRRTKAEVKNQMPSLTRVRRYIEPSAMAQAMLKRMVMKQTSYGNALIATLADKLEPTIDEALTMDNALIFTWRKDDVTALAAMLMAEDKPVVTLTGDMSDAERATTIAKAASATVKPYVVATIDSVGTGVDGLQFVTSNVIYHSLDPTPNKTLQSESRIHRQGQTLPCTSTYMIMNDSADSLVERTVLDKLEQWEAAMGKGEAQEMHQALVTTMTDEAERAALQAIFDSMQGE